mgnify:CR=1 FL=1
MSSYPAIPLQKLVLVREKSVRVPAKMNSTWQASAVAKKLTDGSPDESLMVFCVNGQHELLSAQVVATGAPNNVAFTAAQVFRAAVISNAAGVIVAHNHPSGSTMLSDDDWRAYNAIKAAGQALSIPVLDFIVVSHTQPGCTSVHD